MKLPTFVEVRLWLYKRQLKTVKPSKKTLLLLKKYMEKHELSDEEVKAIKHILEDSK